MISRRGIILGQQNQHESQQQQQQQEQRKQKQYQQYQQQQQQQQHLKSPQMQSDRSSSTHHRASGPPQQVAGNNRSLSAHRKNEQDMMLSSQQDSSNDGRHFDPYSIYSEEEDVWYSEERLFEDHLEEIFNKWQLLDDDIWCKLIIMERNRRIGKAYARVPIVTIDGSHELSYDGYKLALNGFDNPDRDAKTEECRKRIGKGIRIKMDNFGNILIKRLSKAGVYVKEWLPYASQAGSLSDGRIMPSRQQLIKNQLAASGGPQYSLRGAELPGSQVSSLDASSSSPTSSSTSSSSIDACSSRHDSAICDEIIKLGGQLELDKIYVMFDMKKFQANISRELCRAYPDKRRLERQCFSIISLARNADDILNLPCWVMVINIVAIEMLNERFPYFTHMVDHFPDTMLLADQVNGLSRARHRAQAGGSQQEAQTPSFVSIFEHNNGGAGNNHSANMNGASTTTSSSGASSSNNANSSNSNSNNSNNNSNNNKVNGNGIKGGGGGGAPGKQRSEASNGSKEENPYSLPGNALSCSDVKSSMNDYGTATNAHQLDSSIRYYAQRREYYGNHLEAANARGNREPNHHLSSVLDSSRYRSKSNSNIFGAKPIRGEQQATGRFSNNHHRNNSSSIYSPGHMLVPPASDSKPPKLPPRDFAGKKVRSKSSSSVDESSLIRLDPSSGGSGGNVRRTSAQRQAPGSANYSAGNFSGAPTETGAQANEQQQQQQQQQQLQKGNNGGDQGKLVGKKSKKNRFLESLMAPLELAKSSSRSASVMGLPVAFTPVSGGASTPANQQPAQQQEKAGDKKLASKSSSKNFKSLLIGGGGGGHSNANKEALVCEQSNYFDVGGGPKETPAKSRGDGLACSPDEQGRPRFTSGAAAYKDLDIPTPDYETDDNIYALQESSSNFASREGVRANQLLGGGAGSGKPAPARAKKSSGKGSSKAQAQAKRAGADEDLYYSAGGYRGYSPAGARAGHSSRGAPKSVKAPDSGQASDCYAAMGHYVSDAAGPLAGGGGRSAPHPDTIYASSVGLSALGSPARGLAGARCRSASMQRYYSRSQVVARSQASDLYNFADTENPYAMSGGELAELAEDRYGMIGQRGRASRSKMAFSKLSGTSASVAGAPLDRLSHGCTSNMATSNYDIGRSSSGIYGNNSSSSSSDYASWYPQMRKVNSSGYLNSIFKNHLVSPVEPFHENPHNPITSYNNNSVGAKGAGNNNNGKSSSSSNNNNNNNHLSATRSTGNYTSSRTLNTARAGSNLSNNRYQKQQQQQQQQQQKQQQQQQQLQQQSQETQKQALNNNQNANKLVNVRSTYPSYDSSNDSEPSYTNSSDGLDIYDHIQSHTRLCHQYPPMTAAHNKKPAEVHVGEWENIYDQ